ncbi:MAG: magnesium transporter [Parachlamydiales bacterium]|nr:magnesium transporter [Parachlamydiales bacterium]
MDSRTSHLDDLLNQKLEEAFHKQTSKVRLYNIAKIASEHTPIDLAYAASRLPPNVRHVLYENLPDFQAQITFIINTDSNTRSAIFRQLTDEEIKGVIQKMPLDEAVWVLDDLPGRRYRRVLDLIDIKKANYIRELQKHDRYSAGRLMTNEFFAFTTDITIGEAAGYIRDNPGVDLTRRIFVLNQAGELQGYVPGRNLIINPPELPLRQVMKPIIHKVTPDTSRDEVVDLVERYKIPALPVIDEDNFLVGVVTYETVVEAIEDLADETIARMAGTTEDVGGNEPTFKRFLYRAPWLLVTLCGGLVSAASMSLFGRLEGHLLGFVVFFVPLITGMSGNVGIQCSTVLVRSMAIGTLSAGSRNKAVSKEMMIGTMTGIVFGILCGTVIYFLNTFGVQQLGSDPLEIGVIVSFGLFGACLWSSFLGVFFPFFFARLSVDPAVASGPIVTALNDVLSMIMYFLISIAIHSLFFA